MQILISVLCTKGRSMRQAIADDPRIERYKLQVTKEAQPGRAPGWMKLHATDETRGALNVEWDAQSSVLSARVVTRGSRKPSPRYGCAGSQASGARLGCEPATGSGKINDLAE